MSASWPRHCQRRAASAAGDLRGNMDAAAPSLVRAPPSDGVYRPPLGERTRWIFQMSSFISNGLVR